MSTTVAAPPPADVAALPPLSPRRRWFRSNPWRKPRVLEGLTWLFLLWSLAPVAIAVLFSFTAGRNPGAWQGFSLRWYYKDPVLSVWHDSTYRAAIFQTLRLATLTTLISVPIGVAFAIGIDRWRGPAPAFFNFQMLLSFVMPELIIGVALLFLFTSLLTVVRLGTSAQILGLVTFQVSYPVIVCRARLLSIGRTYEEAAMDLGASPLRAIRRVLLPMLYPAVFASIVLVFADCVDDFVIVRYLSSTALTEPMSVQIYDSARSSPTPALNALATIMLVSSMIAVTVGYLLYRRWTKGERAVRESAAGDFALQI